MSALTRALVPVQVCNLLHHFLLKAFPEQYEARAEETRGKSLPLNRDICSFYGFQLLLGSMPALPCVLTCIAIDAEIELDEEVTSVEVSVPIVTQENEWAQASFVNNPQACMPCKQAS